MSNPQGRPADFWHDRYAATDFAYGEAPNEFLASRAGQFVKGQSAFVPADGEGRNGVWLAEQGLEVTTIDLAESGRDKALALAEKRGVSLVALSGDVFEWTWPEAVFDHIVLMFFHLPPEARERLHALVVKALKPGGIVTLEAFTPEHAARREKGEAVGGPPSPDWMMTPDTLRREFATLTELYLEERETVLREGLFHDGPATVVDAVFKKDQ